MLNRIRNWFRGGQSAQLPPVTGNPPPAPKPKRRGLKINRGLTLPAPGTPMTAADLAERFKPPMVMKGTIPAGASKPPEIAMDSMCDAMSDTIRHHVGFNGMSGVDFIGYAALSLIAQHPLIQAIVQTLADEMTRKWIEFKGQGTDGDDDDDAEAEKIKKLTEATEKYKLKEHFNAAMATTGYMGGAMLFIDMGDDTDTAEGLSEVKTKLTLDSGKIKRDSFKGFKLVEPINCYPAPYNASNPLKDGYYVPDAWYVMGKEVHASRLLQLVQNPVPLLLKPAYNFFGIPLAQMALDYVDRFDQVRISVARLVKRFSTSILKTDMSQVLTGGGQDDMQDLQGRAQIFNAFASNEGLFLLDNDSEEFVQVNTPLSGLAEILTQMLELLAAIVRTPAVKLLGISPKGFNATGEYDESNWYDHVASQQSKIFANPLDIAIKVIQLSEFGAIDEDLTWGFVPLHELSETEKATNRKANADTDAAYLDRGVISQEEVRGRLAADPDSGYDSLDVDDLPDPPAVPGEDGEGEGEQSDDLRQAA
ncbi:HI1409 family phage-associated protein [Pararobbsia alpina]|uniref:DUF1073 domain-containing protein n=1 Tax=Pararobbsia alpina TaxID=621374 RepID=UPI0039A6C2FF